MICGNFVGVIYCIMCTMIQGLLKPWSCFVWFVTYRALMESKLLGGTTLIVDRYSYSGVAFSAAKGLDIQWCKVSLVTLGCIMIFCLCINTWKLTSDVCTISGSRCWTYSSRSCNLSGCTTRGILIILVCNAFDLCYIIYTL